MNGFLKAVAAALVAVTALSGCTEPEGMTPDDQPRPALAASLVQIAGDGVAMSSAVGPPDLARMARAYDALVSAGRDGAQFWPDIDRALQDGGPDILRSQPSGDTLEVLVLLVRIHREGFRPSAPGVEAWLRTSAQARLTAAAQRVAGFSQRLPTDLDFDDLLNVRLARVNADLVPDSARSQVVGGYAAVACAVFRRDVHATLPMAAMLDELRAEKPGGCLTDDTARQRVADLVRRPPADVFEALAAARLAGTVNQSAAVRASLSMRLEGLETDFRALRRPIPFDSVALLCLAARSVRVDHARFPALVDRMAAAVRSWGRLSDNETPTPGARLLGIIASPIVLDGREYALVRQSLASQRSPAEVGNIADLELFLASSRRGRLQRVPRLSLPRGMESDGLLAALTMRADRCMLPAARPTPAAEIRAGERDDVLHSAALVLLATERCGHHRPSLAADRRTVRDRSLAVVAGVRSSREFATRLDRVWSAVEALCVIDEDVAAERASTVTTHAEQFLRSFRGLDSSVQLNPLLAYWAHRIAQVARNSCAGAYWNGRA